MYYDKWTEQDPVSPATLIKMIICMNALLEKDDSKPVIVHSTYGIRRTAVYVITAMLMRQVSVVVFSFRPFIWTHF